MGGRAGGDKDPGADDRPHAEGCERNGTEDAAEPVLSLHFFEQHMQRLLGKERVSHEAPVKDERVWNR